MATPTPARPPQSAGRSRVIGLQGAGEEKGATAISELCACNSAKAGIQGKRQAAEHVAVESRFRGNDEDGRG